MTRVRYRAWDGTQSITPLAPEQVLAALADALLSGNIEQALDRALHRGLIDQEGASTRSGVCMVVMPSWQQSPP